MIPTKTYPLSAIMGEEVTDKERIAELEAQLKHCEGHAAELEAEVKMLRLDADHYWENRALNAERELLVLKVVEAENARLKAALDKYSEDEILKGETIERCAKVCDGMWVGHGISQQAALCCAAAIRALKEEK